MLIRSSVEIFFLFIMTWWNCKFYVCYMYKIKCNENYTRKNCLKLFYFEFLYIYMYNGVRWYTYISVGYTIRVTDSCIKKQKSCYTRRRVGENPLVNVFTPLFSHFLLITLCCSFTLLQHFPLFPFLFIYMKMM